MYFYLYFQLHFWPLAGARCRSVCERCPAVDTGTRFGFDRPADSLSKRTVGGTINDDIVDVDVDDDDVDVDVGFLTIAESPLQPGTASPATLSVTIPFFGVTKHISSEGLIKDD